MESQVIYDSWTILMVQDGPGILPDDVRTALKLSACELSWKKRDCRHIVSDVCEGFIETKWETRIVGVRSGILFHSQITIGNGSNCRVNFLLSVDDLARGEKILREMEESGAYNWSMNEERFPIEDLYRFDNLQACGSTRLN